MIKKNILIGILTISILILMVAGASLAYFTDKDDNPKTKYVLGTVNIETAPSAEEVYDLNSSFVCKEAKWTITNTGTKVAKLRARVITIWEDDGDEDRELGNEETAWAVDKSINNKWQKSDICPRFGKGDNQARYNIYNGELLTLKLGAGENYIDVGSVKIWDDGEYIYIDINTKGNWKLSETHLYVGTTVPQKSAPGQLGNECTPNSKSYTYQLLLPEGNNIYISLHAVVKRENKKGGPSNTQSVAEPEYSIEVISDGWTKEPDDDGWYYYEDSVSPQEEIPFHVKVCLKEYWEGSLEIAIEAEAVQASNNAPEYEWGNGQEGSDE